MITKNANKYCKDDISLIANYKEAMADTETVWQIHHILELTIDGEYALSHKDLQRMGLYYDRPYYELVFLTPTEHKRIHGKRNASQNLNKESKFGENNPRFQKCSSIFGDKYLAHFGYSKTKNSKQYYVERYYYNKNGKCSWE